MSEQINKFGFVDIYKDKKIVEDNTIRFINLALPKSSLNRQYRLKAVQLFITNLDGSEVGYSGLWGAILFQTNLPSTMVHFLDEGYLNKTKLDISTSAATFGSKHSLEWIGDIPVPSNLDTKIVGGIANKSGASLLMNTSALVEELI